MSARRSSSSCPAPDARTPRGGYPRGGALLTYGPNIDDIVRRSAVHVDKILRGARPTDVPVEQPTKFELVINLQTAKVL
ncbi:MAG TPA: ABC transporter substrate binding protein, partial [Candidatus Dormibacteraeota bacterium]|nr:ABC transporter substrate binding protein [Candidatus Dormibacteraeota bacterium]